MTDSLCCATNQSVPHSRLSENQAVVCTPLRGRRRTLTPVTGRRAGGRKHRSFRVGRPAALAVAVCSLLFTTAGESASAYKLVVRKQRVHEAMVGSSVQCYLRARKSGSQVGSCAMDRALSAELEAGQDNASAVEGISLGRATPSLQDLKSGVRWPDDPQRKLRGARGIRSAANFGSAFSVFRYCKKYKDKPINEAGLLCASHFGGLQFLHAMASHKDESSAETKARILDWARLSYDFASASIKDGDALCDVASRYPTIERSLTGSPSSFICKGGKIKQGGKWVSTEPRTVGEFFGFTCKRALTSTQCHVTETSIAERRIAALGALLHVVQDSYSQGHARRTVNGKAPTRPAVVRGPIEQFFDYNQQRGREHGKLDEWPLTLPGDGCPNQVDHPIAAGAKLLEFVANQADSDTVVDYLDSHVFVVSCARSAAH